MKFKLSNKDVDKLYELLNQNEYNIYMADVILDFINSNQRYLSDVEESKMFDEFIKRLNIDKQVKFLEKEYFPKGINKLDDSKYKENPYFKNIRISNTQFLQYTLGYETYKPQEIFISDDYYLDDNHNYMETPRLGYFENTHKFIAIKENNVIWMSITPAETDTMVDHINKMHGKIITFGLGLGYFQYMSALKDNVESVTIVERDENIINLFKTHILPQFGDVKDKIIILHEDAYNCMDNFDQYDCVYVDLWHNPNDGIGFYWDFKKVENNFPNTEFYYWLEDGIIALIRRCLINLIGEQFEEHLGPDCYLKEANIYDRLINNAYKLLKKTTFTAYDEIYNFLSRENIVNMIKTL